MAATTNPPRILCLTLLFGALVSLAAAQSCVVPDHFQGQFYSRESGQDRTTTINDNSLDNEKFSGQCVGREDVNSSIADPDGRFDSKILFRTSNYCHRCFLMFYRTPNIIQYKYSECRTTTDTPDLEDVCNDIPSTADYYTFFRLAYVIVNCKNTFEGAYNFSYEWETGGGGPCRSPQSSIIACQEPGSILKDNNVFYMNFGKCDDISTSRNEYIEFRCLGSWQDEDGNVWSGVQDVSKQMPMDRYRCMLTRHDQEEDENRRWWTMSWWAECGVLKSYYEGPVRLLVQPVVGGHHLTLGSPQCLFPTNYSGHWFHNGEYDVDVDINATHIYFRTKIDQYTFKESYFVCMMNSGTRYLTMAITVGKCELDFVCYDLLPRHHSIVRWRMSKPFRLTDYDLALPDFMLYMFRQACTWSSFTIDRTDIHWNYKTFLLNPPVPISCPIRGRYYFTQKGPETELIRTRIRGITERPRHMINCEQYVTEFKSCDVNPSRISLDAEYCETVDHTGRPIGEYDEADWELTCVGHWDEDWQRYMITWDPEDPTSPFRCWNFERTDWRHVWLSRSTTASCHPGQSSISMEPEEGASLAMNLTEAERLFDDCAQDYRDGDPWKIWPDVLDWNSSNVGTVSWTLLFSTSIIVALFGH